ncbi:MAG: AAA family ATPase [Methanoregula sp.]|nr:AAA family ATPase [Methanoregula sp.]
MDDFNKYNLIYGWNGSGKTTLSNFLRQIELCEMSPDCGAFNIVTENGTITEKNISEVTLSLKVFNQDFVKENIFTATGEISPIFYLGREDIATKKTLESLKKQQYKLFDTIEKDEIALSQQSQRIEKYCSTKAKEIKDFLHSAGENKYNNYDKSNFKTRCSLLEKEDFSKKILPPDDVDKLKLITNSKSREKISSIRLDIPRLTDLESESRIILTTTVTAKVIERLNRDSKLNTWVAQGLLIIKDKNLEACPFCERELPSDLIEQLDGHFNDEYEKFLQKIDQLISKFTLIKQNSTILLPSKSDFYDEITSDFEKNKQKLTQELSDYTTFIDSLINDLDEKRKNPFVRMEMQYPLPAIKLSDTIEEINSIINMHNSKTENFTTAILNARQTLEDHLVAERLDDYFEMLITLETTREEDQKNKVQYSSTTNQIVELEKKIIEHRTPAEEINTDLRNYLGHEEIRFDLEGEGYQILRNGVVAEALSEGEKTAVSFIYFLKTLRDKDFDFENSTIIIDDPISSLDSNSLYNAFSFLKNRTECAQQLIVLTHNYSFFKEVKNWLLTHKSRSEKSSMYMIKNTFVDNCRIAELHPLDDLLKKYTSEYHYLFSLVHYHAISPKQELKNYYLLPNISRRLLESFFAFRYPTQVGNFGNQFEKSKISKEKKTRIMRYTDANSHSDHIRADTEGDLSYLDETPQVLNDILELMKIDDERHYNEMMLIVN